MVHLNVFLILLITWGQISNAVQRKLLLSIYYESKCPDSQSFILKQLQPAFRILHKYLKLRFVPFGKARSINYGDGGFECQHGSSECLGNMVQECSLHQMKGQSDKSKLAYVACEMYTMAGSLGRFDCVKKSNLTSELVEQCVTSGKGTILQLESEYYTSLVKPKFIPTITINGEFNQEIQDYAQTDLTGALCSILVNCQPCAQYYNYVAMNNLLNTH